MSEDTNTQDTQVGGRTAGEKKTPIMNILSSDGSLRLVVPEGTDKAVYREYDYKDAKTGETKHGAKWELIFKSLAGKITNIQEYDGDYGTNFMVTLTYDGGEDVVSIGTNTAFGEDFMKKLPNINLNEFVTLSPFSFTDANGKSRKGISITQGDAKIDNFFSEKWTEGGRPKALNGYPEPKGDTSKYTKDKWKAYFLDARIFLVDYTKEHFLPQFAHLSRQAAPKEQADPNF